MGDAQDPGDELADGFKAVAAGGVSRPGERTTYIDWKNGGSGKHNLAWSKTARDKLDEVDKAVEDLDLRDRCMGR